MQEVEQEDLEFERLLSDKRHQELIRSIKELGDLLSKFNNVLSDLSVDKKDTLHEDIKQSILSLKEFFPVPKDNGDIITAINTVADRLSPKEQPKEWTFFINRNNAGGIYKVIAKQTNG